MIRSARIQRQTFVHIVYECAVNLVFSMNALQEHRWINIHKRERQQQRRRKLVRKRKSERITEHMKLVTHRIERHNV